MNSSSHLDTFVRLVRASALALAASLLVGFVAVQAFTSQYGTASSTVVLDASGTDDTRLTSAIRQQEATGLVCSEKPVLTDVILFQHDHGDPVKVLTFDAAIRASAAKDGWIRRYCV